MIRRKLEHQRIMFKIQQVLGEDFEESLTAVIQLQFILQGFTRVQAIEEPDVELKPQRVHFIWLAANSIENLISKDYKKGTIEKRYSWMALPNWWTWVDKCWNKDREGERKHLHKSMVVFLNSLTPSMTELNWIHIW